MKQYENLPLISINRGKGIWLYDFNDKRYLDAISSWWVNLFGHTNSYINHAVQEQLEKLEHVMLAGFTHEPVVDLSERLIKLAPDGLNHCFYSSDGASAIESALKMSFHFWHNNGQSTKNNFISLQNGYHGETLGALSVTDVPIFSKVYTPLLRKSTRILTPDWRYAEEGELPKDYALRAASYLENYLAKNHTITAAFIIEPLVQGAVGMGMYHSDYLKYAREICNKYQVHLIADEIAVGFGRTGTMFACEQANITPDFLCLAKGLTSGYLPLSAVLTTKSIYQAFYHKEATRAFLHSHTHAGNALACSAALATLDIFEQNKPIQANYKKIKYLNEISKPIASHNKVRNFRNCGMIWAFEVKDTNPSFSENFFQRAIDQGLLLRPLGNTVYFMPPYIINKKEMEFLVEGTLKILNSY
tara:strand:- start:1380 stop:2630 length:1251 start_codon:yes stop_codon:yes gene_type:complete